MCERRPVRRLVLAALVGPTLVMSTAVDASAEPALWTVAGTESMAAPVRRLCTLSTCQRPQPIPRAWPATGRRVFGTCLGHRPDGTIVLCQDDRLIEVRMDGIARQRRFGPAGASGEPAQFLGVDVDPQGRPVVATDGGSMRVETSGRRTTLTSLDAGADVGGGDVADDGTVCVAEGYRNTVLAIAPTGEQRIVAGMRRGRPDEDGGFDDDEGGFAGDGGPATAALLDVPRDVSAAPNGVLLIVDQDNRRVRAVDAAGTIRTVAGGGRGFAEARRGTDVALRPTAVHALANGSALIATEDRGLLRLGADGRVRTVVRRSRFVDAPAEPAAVATDGQPPSRLGLGAIEEVDVLPTGEVLVLVVQEQGLGGSRIAMLAEPGRTRRLAVALLRGTRQAIRRGAVALSSTRRASGTLQVVHGTSGRVLRRRRITVPAGRTTLRIGRLAGAEPHLLRVDLRTADGQTAAHRLTVLPRVALTGRALRAVVARIGRLLAVDGHRVYGCRRRTARRFDCRARGRRPVRISARRDGLVDYVERTGRRTRRFVLEPELPSSGR